jgi:flagellar basal-body rod protein FlgB
MAPGASARFGTKRRKFRYAQIQTPGFGRTKFDRTGRGVGVPAASLVMLQTAPNHMASISSGAGPSQNAKSGYQTRPAGNQVSLEEEMMKSAQNQMDYAAATSLYSKSLNLLKTAIGKR